MAFFLRLIREHFSRDVQGIYTERDESQSIHEVRNNLSELFDSSLAESRF